MLLPSGDTKAERTWRSASQSPTVNGCLSAGRGWPTAAGKLARKPSTRISAAKRKIRAGPEKQFIRTSWCGPPELISKTSYHRIRRAAGSCDARFDSRGYGHLQRCRVREGVAREPAGGCL